MRKKLSRIIAWAVTLGLLGYIFSTVSLAEVARAITQTAPWTAPVVALLVLVVYLADSLAIWKTFGWFLTRLTFREVLIVRGASYLLAIINYALGQGAMVYFMNRSRGVPLLRGAGAVMLVMGVNVLLLLLLTSCGVALTPDLPPLVTTIVTVAYAGLAVYVTLQLARPRFLASRALFDILLGVSLTGHLKAIAVRVPHVLSLVVLMFACLHGFGIQVPFTHALVFLPIVFFIAVLPISVQGWGPTQWAMITFFSKYAPGNDPRAVVFAASAFGSVIGIAVQSLIGVICLRNQLARDLGVPPVRAT